MTSVGSRSACCFGRGLVAVDLPGACSLQGVTRFCYFLGSSVCDKNETHVRGFTIHPSSGAVHPGTFAALTEKIPYLLDLGVTALELMPVLEFNENESKRLNPITGERLKNYWGYDPVAFFAPKQSYCIGGAHGQQVQEFREMVKAFHCAGIEVILDIVLNHTAENDELGLTICLRGIENSRT